MILIFLCVYYRIRQFFRKLSMHKLWQLTHKLNKVRRTLRKVCELAAGVYTYIIS